MFIFVKVQQNLLYLLTKLWVSIFFSIAEVVELADALVSGTSSLRRVGVQVPPSALDFNFGFLQIATFFNKLISFY